MSNQSQAQPRHGEPCAHKSSCKLFPILKASNALDYWTKVYCDGNWSRCARYEKLVRGEQVAPNLLPNGKKI